MRLVETDKQRESSIEIPLSTENYELRDFLKKRFNLSDENIEKILSFEKKDNILVPVSVFSTKLSSLEALTQYLKNFHELSFSEIASLLNRDQRTIWHAYNRSINKGIEIDFSDSSINIPVEIFSNRNYSLLETIVCYLKDKCFLQHCEISPLLNLNQKTIWTVYHRVLKKNETN